MNRMRLLMLILGFDDWAWGRFEDMFKALADHFDLQFVLYEDDVDFDVNWAKTVRVEKPVRGLLDYRYMAEHVKRILMEVDSFDALYIRSGSPIQQFIAVLMKTMAKRPAVIRINGDGSYVRPFYMSPGEKIWLDTFDTVSLNCFDLIVPICSTLERLMTSRVMNRERVTEPVPISVDTSLFKPLELPGNTVLGYAGRIAPEKASTFMKEVMEATPETEYQVAGRIQIPGYMFPDNCHFLGELRRKEMPELYRRCSVIILPSYSEGLPNAILESYASCRPVIVTPQAHPPELPVFGWELPHDLEQWVKVINNLDPEEVAAIGAKARDWICTSWATWEDFGKNMAEKIMRVK